MALPATDDFNDGAGVTPANWTEQLNGIHCTAGGTCIGDVNDLNFAYWSGDVFADDQYSKAKYVNGAYAGVTVRASGSGAGAYNAYVLQVRFEVSALFKKFVNGSETLLQSFAVPLLNAIIEIRAVGSSISVYYDGVQQGTTEIDSALAAGSAGIMFSGDVAELDDWEGGNIAAPRLYRRLPITQRML
jgi:hypothetical protein